MRLVARQAEQVGEGRTGRWGIGSTKAAAATGSAIAHSHRSCWQSMTIPASSRSKYATGTTSRGADCKPPVHAAVRAICWISPGICRHPKPSRMRARLPAPSPEGLPMEPSAEAPASPTAGPSPAPRWYGRPPGRWRAWSTMPTESGCTKREVGLRGLRLAIEDMGAQGDDGIGLRPPPAHPPLPTISP
jgi:hypothetical protein